MENIRMILALGLCIINSYNFVQSDENQDNIGKSQIIVATEPSTFNFMPDTDKQSDEAIILALVYKYVKCMQTEAINEPTGQCTKPIKKCNEAFSNELLIKKVKSSRKH